MNEHDHLMLLFDKACALSESQQTAFIGKTRQSNAALALDLETMLKNDRLSGDFFESQEGRLDVAALVGPTWSGLEDGSSIREPFESTSTEADPRIGSVIDNRFRLDELVGSGATGEVFRATDLERPMDVAIKLLRSDLIHHPRQVLRFRREFRVISRIQHRGCLSVFQEGRHEDQHFIVMEYIAGGSFETLVGAPSIVLIPVLIQLAHALDFVHSQQIVHRDLKLENVLLQRSGSIVPKLADFGITKIVSDNATKLTDTGAILGTINYMAPELFAGAQACPRSDLYSLGCMMYRLWSGTSPFSGGAYQQMRSKVESPAPQLRTVVPEIPEDLNLLVARLLERDPKQRPRRAIDVANELLNIYSQLAGPSLPSSILEDPHRSTRSFIFPTGLVGRESQLEQLCTDYDTAASTPKTPIVIRGVAGIGKTTLVTAFSQALTKRDISVLHIRCGDTLNTPFSPFPALQHSLEQRLNQPLPPTEEPSLGVYRAPYASDAGVVARRALAIDIAKLLWSAHQKKPICVIIEDLHQTGKVSLSLLSDLLEQLETFAEQCEQRPVLAITTRPNNRLFQILEERQIPAVQLQLLPLTENKVAELAAAMLATTTAELPQSIRNYLDRTCHGNPLLVHSVMRTLMSRGEFSGLPQEWEISEEKIDKALCDSTGTVLLSRLNTLNTRTVEILRAAAVCRDDFDVELLCSITSTPQEAVVDALDEAVNVQILQISEVNTGTDTYHFAHVLLAKTLRDALEKNALCTYHDAIANFLEQRDSESEILTFHFRRGSNQQKGFEFSRSAGHAALEARDYESAVLHYNHALDFFTQLDEESSSDSRVTCIEPLADALLIVGQKERAIELYRELVSLSNPSDNSVLLSRRLRKLGLALFRTNSVQEGLSILRQGLTVLGHAIPQRRAFRMVHLLWNTLCLGANALFGRFFALPEVNSRDTERALLHRELSFRSRWVDMELALAHQIAFIRLAQKQQNRNFLPDAYAGTAVGFAVFGWHQLSERYLQKAHQLASNANNFHSMVYAGLYRGSIETLLNDEENVALAHFSRAVQVAEELGDRFVVSLAYATRGWGGILLGRWKQAAADFLHAESTAAEFGVPWLQADSSCGTSMIALFQGNFADAATTARKVLASDIRISMPVFDALATEILGAEAFLTGRFQDAMRMFESARERYDEHHLQRGWGFLVDIEHNEALLCLIDEQGFQAVPDALLQLRNNAKRAKQRMNQFPLYRGCDSMMRGIYHARKGNPSLARKLFAQSQASRSPSGTNYIDTWISVRVAIECWRLGDSKPETAAQLDSVARTYKAIGLDGWCGWLRRIREIHQV